MTNRPPEPRWSAEDQALLLTCQMIGDMQCGVVPPVRAQTMFRLPPDTVAFTSGPVRVHELRAAGDGSYSTQGGFVFGTGTLGLALMAGSLVANHTANNRARRTAEANAQVAFRHQFDGTLFVTNRGWLFHTAQALMPWQYEHVESMQLVRRSHVVAQAQTDRGPLTWQIMSPFAELIFAMWALDQHPQHPQLVDGSWLPDPWFAHARAMGRRPALESGRIAQAPQQIRLPGQQLPPR